MKEIVSQPTNGVICEDGKIAKNGLIDAPIGRHSEKPAETRDRIAALAGGRYDRTICQTGGPRLGRLGRRSAADRKRGKP